MNAGLLLVLLALPAAAAHTYPIEPVTAVLRVEPDRVVADLRTDSVFWLEEVTGVNPLPSTGWPEQALNATEAYVNAHFRLTVDGARVPGKLVDARYRQLPTQVHEQGLFILRLTYPPVPDGASLSLQADFFEEFRREELEEFGGRLPPQHVGKFITRASIPGRKRLSAVLSSQAAPLAFTAADARRTALGRALESAGAGALSLAGSAAAWPALIALALCLGPAAPGRGRPAAWAASLLAGWCAPLPAPVWLPWAAGLAAGAAVAPRSNAARAAASAAALAALARVWAVDARPWLPRGAPGALEASLAGLGALIAAAAVLAALWLGVRAARRGLDAVSQSRAEHIYARRLSLAKTVLMIVCGYGLWQSLSR